MDSVNRHELMKEGRIERVYAVSPDGRETDVEKIFPAFYKFTPETQGIVQVRLTSAGPWMFTTTHEIPYPDRDECDKYLYRTSLTIGF